MSLPGRLCVLERRRVCGACAPSSGRAGAILDVGFYASSVGSSGTVAQYGKKVLALQRSASGMCDRQGTVWKNRDEEECM